MPTAAVPVTGAGTSGSGPLIPYSRCMPRCNPTPVRAVLAAFQRGKGGGALFFSRRPPAGNGQVAWQKSYRQRPQPGLGPSIRPNIVGPVRQDQPPTSRSPNGTTPRPAPALRCPQCSRLLALRASSWATPGWGSTALRAMAPLPGDGARLRLRAPRYVRGAAYGPLAPADDPTRRASHRGTLAHSLARR